MRGAAGTLRVAPGIRAPASLGRFAIVTAYNPASALTSTQDNRAALRRLRAELNDVRWLPARGHGTGPRGRAWDEPAFALLGAASHALALALGERLNQNAVLLGLPGGLPWLAATRPGFCGRSVGERL